MALSKQINITVVAKTATAQKEVDDLKKRISSLEKGLEKGGKAGNAAGKSITAGLGRSIVVANQALGIISRVSSSLEKMAKRSVQMSGVTAAFNGTGASLEKLKTATDGMISKYDLMANYNLALQLGVAKTESEFGNLANAAGKLGMSLGQDVSKSLEDVMRGIGRASPMILDNLGVIVSAAEANANWAEANDRTVSSMDDLDRKAAFQAEAIKKVVEAAREIPQATEHVQGMARAMVHLNESADAVAEGFEWVMTSMSKYYKRLDDVEARAAIIRKEKNVDHQTSLRLARKDIEAREFQEKVNAIVSARSQAQAKAHQEKEAKELQEHLGEMRELRQTIWDEKTGTWIEALPDPEEEKKIAAFWKARNKANKLNLDLEREAAREAEAARKERARIAEAERRAAEAHAMHVLKVEHKSLSDLRELRIEAQDFDAEHKGGLQERRLVYLEQLEENYAKEREIESEFGGDKLAQAQALFENELERSNILMAMKAEEIAIEQQLENDKKRHHANMLARKKEEAETTRALLQAEKAAQQERIQVANKVSGMLGRTSDAMTKAVFNMFEKNQKGFARQIADFAKAQSQEMVALSVRYTIEGGVHAAALNPVKSLASFKAAGIALAGAASLAAMFGAAKAAVGSGGGGGRRGHSAESMRTWIDKRPKGQHHTHPAISNPSNNKQDSGGVTVNATVIGSTEDQVALALNKILNRGRQQTG